MTSKKAPVRVPVTERALLQRINRKLAADEKKILKLRGMAAGELGDYVVIPVPSAAAGQGSHVPLSRVEQTNVDPEKLGRELGVLRPYEALA